MSHSNRVILVLAVLVILSILSLGFLSKRSEFVVLGTSMLTLGVVIGGGVLLVRVLRPALRQLNPRVIVIVCASVYLALVILVFVVPELSILVGALMVIGPTFVYLVALRAGSIGMGDGCLPVILTVVGGLILLLLGWLFQREAFYSVIGSL